MKKRTLTDTIRGYGLGILLGTTTVALATNATIDHYMEVTHEQRMANMIDQQRVAAGMVSAKETTMTDDMYARAERLAQQHNAPFVGLTRVQVIDKLLTNAEKNAKWFRQISRLDLAEAKEKMTYEEFVELAGREAKDNPTQTGNIDFDADTVARIKRLQEINHQAYVNVIKNRPTNVRLNMLMDEAERFMKEGNWAQAEIVLERIDNELTPEQSALVVEAHVKDHHDKANQGKYSLYEDYLRTTIKQNPDHQVQTPEQAREHTIWRIEDTDRLRQIGGHKFAPRVELKDFGIEGYDIDAFEVKPELKGMPYTPPQPTPLPVINGIQPGDIRGR